ncbi:MAG: tryptophan--tRNA ligase [Ignavibacteriales bacterium]|nr:tryptophan--tRNA ligase [Ignavibacteriales bacterium]
MNAKRVLSGMRPSGKLHIGHYVGALQNWVALQNDDGYDNYHLIADYHALTTNLDTSNVEEDSIEMTIDWIAAGIDPEKSPIFRQSQIKQHAELYLIFGMLVTANRLERNPTLKDQIRDLNIKQVVFGHLGYPALQAADILLYKGECVPVGEDQVPHVEITREIARRFNNHYGEVFPDPEPLLSRAPRLVGLDGDAKMSKSLNNTVLLSDPPETVEKKLRKAKTDPQKVRKGDPGRPDVCLIYSYQKVFNSDETEAIDADCRSGALGCADCKMRVAAKINDELAPIIERRKELEADREKVRRIVIDGEARARETAEATMREARDGMKMGALDV